MIYGTWSYFKTDGYLDNRKNDERVFICSSDFLDMWLYQNKAELLECVEGCLLDNMLFSIKGGTAAIYEHHVNPNASDYRIYCTEAGSSAEEDLFHDFYELCDEYKEEV